MISSEGEQWGRYNLSRDMEKIKFMFQSTNQIQPPTICNMF